VYGQRVRAGRRATTPSIWLVWKPGGSSLWQSEEWISDLLDAARRFHIGNACQNL
jgi:hypothetical protein